MKRAFVTGASGFIGSFVVEQLVASGVEVAILRRPETDLWRLGPAAGQVQGITGDLDQAASYREALVEFAPEVVLHLAWHGVANSLRNDRTQVERNLHATLSLVETAADAGARAWVGAGSQAEYGRHEGALDENALTRPTTLYGAAKLSACHLAGRMADLRGLRFAWLRVFSTFGPRDNPGWMIPSLIRALGRRERPALTEGEQRWDYLAVQDAAAAFQAVAASTSAEGVFNLGSGSAPRLRDTIEFIRDCVDPTLPLGFGEVAYRPDQVMHLQAETGRLRAATGWVPGRSLEQALRETVRWYLEHPL